MISSRDILEDEVRLLIDDIIQVYEESGKKVTGQFSEGLESKVTDNKIELFGYPYLAGRPKGKMPPVSAIQKWVEDRGINSLSLDASGLAWAIAIKIAREGTSDESHLPIYEEVLTPSRMDYIISKVSEFHVKQFVEEITLRITAISQKYTK
jgi:hypothetical protein